MNKVDLFPTDPAEVKIWTRGFAFGCTFTTIVWIVITTFAAATQP
jgi:hypothetical protein